MQTTLIFCLAFITGSIASIFSSWTGSIWAGGAIILGLGFSIALVMPLLWQQGPKRWVWLLAALIACIASFYLQFRTPSPKPDDISKFAPAVGATVQGTVIESPTTTRSDRAKFTLAVTSVKLETDKSAATKPQQASGKLYTTVSLVQSTGLRPGQAVEITGTLYKPNAANNPGEFDFQLFLARQGVFAGFSGRKLALQGDPPGLGEWWIRSRMVRAHVLGAGMPEGALLSSLVLGNRAVDLPVDLKDRFIAVGLAAALAASGYQVSLILGVVLYLSRTCTPTQQFLRGVICLLGFLALTGVSPSVLRAVVMGLGGLVGLVTGRRGRPIASLTLAAVTLLLINPLWIWDLGFQFSFLATLGLIVTVEPLTKKMPWLPPLIATVLAISIAAYIWTLPLQLFVFGKVSIYSILANVIATPLITLATVGGILSGFLGVIWDYLGAVVSWLMLTPLALIISIANWIYTLPGATSSAGTISIWQMIAAYSIGILVWLQPWWRKRWLPAAVITLIVVFVPSGIARGNLFQVTLLDAGQTPIMLVQNQGQTTLINSGDRQTANFTLLPLLQKSGINQIDWAISTDPQPDFSDGWNSLLENTLPVKNFRDVGATTTSKSYLSLTNSIAGSGGNIASLSVDNLLQIAPDLEIELLSSTPGIMYVQTGNTTWLLLANADLKAQRLLLDRTLQKSTTQAQILWWTGGNLLPELLQVVKPTTAIASSLSISESTLAQLRNSNIRLYWTSRDGAIQWNKDNEVRAFSDREDASSPF